MNSLAFEWRLLHTRVSLVSLNFKHRFFRAEALWDPASLPVVVGFSSLSDLVHHDGSSDYRRSSVLFFLSLCNRMGPWREGPLGELRRSGGSSKVQWLRSVWGRRGHTGNRLSVIGAKVFFLRLNSTKFCDGGSLEWDGGFSLRCYLWHGTVSSSRWGVEEQVDLGPVRNGIFFRSRRLGFWNRIFSLKPTNWGRGTPLRVASSTEPVVDLERAWTPQPCNVTGDGFASHGVHLEEEACFLCLLSLNLIFLCFCCFFFLSVT